MAIVGRHALLDFSGIHASVLTDAAAIGAALLAAARAARMTPLGDPVTHIFPGGAVTAMLPLAESHIAVHTYPELGYLAGDLFTCGGCDIDAAIAVLRGAFQPETAGTRILERGPEAGSDCAVE